MYKVLHLVLHRHRLRDRARNLRNRGMDLHWGLSVKRSKLPSKVEARGWAEEEEILVTDPNLLDGTDQVSSIMN